MTRASGFGPPAIVRAWDAAVLPRRAMMRRARRGGSLPRRPACRHAVHETRRRARGIPSCTAMIFHAPRYPFPPVAGRTCPRQRLRGWRRPAPAFRPLHAPLRTIMIPCKSGTPRAPSCGYARPHACKAACLARRSGPLRRAEPPGLAVRREAFGALPRRRHACGSEAAARAERIKRGGSTAGHRPPAPT